MKRIRNPPGLSIVLQVVAELRAVRASKTMVWGTWAFCVAAVITLTVMIISCKRDMESLSTLLARGVMIDAPVTDRHISYGKSRTYYISYELPDADGNTEFRDVVDSGTYYSTGSTLPVTYIPGSLSIRRIGPVDQPRIDEETTHWFVGFACATLFFGFFVGLMALIFRYEKRLLEAGLTANGRVDSNSIVGSGRNASRRILYHFTDSNGQPQSRTARLAPMNGRQIVQGAPVPVFYTYPNSAKTSRIEAELTLAQIVSINPDFGEQA